jgi:hypothetical protein
MGFYYGPSRPPEEEKEPGGCLEALILTRAAFGALLLPVGILFGALGGLVAVLFLFTVHALLGVLALVALVLLVALYARWERGRFRSGPPM